MPAIPTKLFDVRNGNGAVDSDSTVYNRATLIVFRDNTAKDAVVAALCSQYNLPNLQSNFNKILTDFIKAHYRLAKGNEAAVSAQSNAATDLP